MKRPVIRIIDGDEIIDREMNDTEFAQFEASQAANLIAKAEADARATAKAALLNKLGITAEEARLLLS